MSYFELFAVILRINLKIKELIQVSYDLQDPKTYKREINALISVDNDLNADNLTIITHDIESEETVNDRRIAFKPLIKWLLE